MREKVLKNKNLKLLWQNWSGLKILILGFGKEGKDSFFFLRKLFPEKVLGVADRNEKLKIKNKKLKIRWHLGKDYLKAIEDYDIIIKSPGIPIHLAEVERAFKEKKVILQSEIFLENCPGKVVGVTGTKGKSTTALLIYKILKEGGLKAHLVGNIGKPVLNLLFSATPKDIYVYELSCHQLYNLKKSPPIAVFLNIFPEHLDYYRNFREYLRAKANITSHQTKNDYFIYNSKDKILRKIAKKSKAKKIALKNYSQVLKNLGIRKNPFGADFYLLNIAAAVKVGKIFGVPKRDIVKALRNFKPLPHRLEYVGTFKEIAFYNDALSTIPETAILAMEALGKKVETVFLGGFDRKTDFKKLAKFILRNKNIKNLILFPPSGEKIWKEIFHQSKNKKRPTPFFVNNMREAVKVAFDHTRKGKICLLSPASASFGIFRDYKEKGNLFKKYVKKYGQK